MEENEKQKFGRDSSRKRQATGVVELQGTGMKTVEHRMESGRQQVWLELYGTGMKSVEYKIKRGRLL